MPTSCENGPSNDESSGHTQTHPYQHAQPPLPYGRGSDQGRGADLTTIAAMRSTQPATLLRILRADLDWVVMKWLEKDRTRRYDTANALAMDVQRFLKNEPVVAGPPSATYRVRKFVRRNRASAILATAVIFGIAATLTGTSVMYFRAERARQTAETARESEAEQRRQAEDAREAEKKERQRAEDALTEAERAKEETVAERDRAQAAEHTAVSAMAEVKESATALRRSFYISSIQRAGEQGRALTHEVRGRLSHFHVPRIALFVCHCS